jgi:hypothetical protein
MKRGQASARVVVVSGVDEVETPWCFEPGS